MRELIKLINLYVSQCAINMRQQEKLVEMINEDHDCCLISSIEQYHDGLQVKLSGEDTEELMARTLARINETLIKNEKVLSGMVALIGKD